MITRRLLLMMNTFGKSTVLVTGDADEHGEFTQLNNSGL